MARSGRIPKSKEWLEPENLQRIREWAASGVLEKDIARNHIGIAPETWCKWKIQFPQFHQAIKDGIKDRCRFAEDSIKKLIGGITYTEKRTEIISKGEEITSTKVVEVEKYIPPNTAAVIFFLTNNDPERWPNGRYVVQDQKENQEDSGNSPVSEWLKATRPNRKAVSDLFEDESEVRIDGGEDSGKEEEE